MWKLVGVDTRQVYQTAVHKSDLNKWYEDTYCVRGKLGSMEYRVPETMQYVHVIEYPTSKQKASDLLDDHDYEGYRKLKGIDQLGAKEQVIYDKYKTIDEKMIKRRKRVNRLFNSGMSRAEISRQTGISKTTITTDMYALGVKYTADSNTWSPEEDTFLIEHRTQMTAHGIANELKRSINSVNSRWSYLVNTKAI